MSGGVGRFLDRDSVPLSARQWQDLDRTVVAAARQALIGRRFLPVFGPLGAGVQTVPIQEFEGAYAGAADYTGDADCGTLRAQAARTLPLPIIHKDFLLLWRNVAGDEVGMPLDVAPAASAAQYAARKEDDLIFHGSEALGVEGLLTVPGRQVLTLSDWTRVGSAFGDIIEALTRLGKAGFYGPYALVVPPALYAQMHGVHERTGVLEIRNIEELVTGGIFRSTVLPENKAVVVAVGSHNMDLAVAQDFSLAALGPEHMNLLLRVFEMVGLRIKQPQAVVTLERPVGPGLAAK